MTNFRRLAMFTCVERPILLDRVSVLVLFGLKITAMLPAQSVSPPPVFDPPKGYYLALGDSFAYGYQPAKGNAGLPASSFSSGLLRLMRRSSSREPMTHS